MNKYDNRYLILQTQKLTQIIKKQSKVTDIAQEFNVFRQTIHKWLNRYKRFGTAGLIKQKRKKIDDSGYWDSAYPSNMLFDVYIDVSILH
jgi:predicted transcriptional regulator